MRLRLGTGLAAATILAAGAAIAEYPADSEITFVIPYSPGGGFDTIVRSYAPVMGEIMGTTVVPENIPGAGGSRGGQAVYRAEPDGYTIGVYNIPGLTVSEITGTDLGFGLNEVTWIANLATEVYALAVKADSPINTVEELCSMGQPPKLSDTGSSSTASVTSVISFSIMGCEMVDVTAYEGSNDAMIGVIRGDVDATVKPISSLHKYVESGDMKIILTYTKTQVLDGVPSVADIGHPELAKFTINRVIGGPPGMPAEIVQKLSDALEAATKSDTVQTWAEGAGVDLEFMNAADTKAMMDDLSVFYSEYKNLLVTN